ELVHHRQRDVQLPVEGVVEGEAEGDACAAREVEPYPAQRTDCWFRNSSVFIGAGGLLGRSSTRLSRSMSPAMSSPTIAPLSSIRIVTFASSAMGPGIRHPAAQCPGLRLSDMAGRVHRQEHELARSGFPA